MKALVVAIWITTLAACGSDGPPKCDTADCSIPGTTVVKWEFDQETALGFPDDSCGDVGAIMVHVDATNAADGSASMAQDVTCGNGQVSFVGLEPGSYTMAVTPLDINGASLVKAPSTVMIDAAATNMTTQTTVEVPFTAWTTTYTGTLLFRLTWGGQSCAMASPAVVTQTLKLTAGGQVVTAKTDSGHKIDGTDPEPCKASTDQFPEFVDGLPSGPATLVVIGEDSDGTTVFSHSFDTFVGVAKNNPTLTYDVPAPSADAGVDAPSDAVTDAPPDA